MLKYRYLSARIFTYAGTGSPGYAGDGGLATHAALNGPAGIAFDADDNLYIADLLNHVIRRVDAVTRIITTVAGCGRAGFGGDDGPAVHALLNGPEGVSADPDGNLYIADSGNNRIRKLIVGTNTVETAAGTGEAGYAGDGWDGRFAALNHPAGVVADAKRNVHFNDYRNDRIRRIDPSGRISSVAGNGKHGYWGDNGPAAEASVNDVYGLAVDKRGNLYIMDSLNFAVRKVDAVTGIITTVVGTGKPGSSPEFTPIGTAGIGGKAHEKGKTGGKVPHAVEISAEGDVFIAETGLGRIRVADNLTGQVYTVAGTGASGISLDGNEARYSPMDVHGLRMDSKGNLYFNDFHSHVVRVLRFSG